MRLPLAADVPESGGLDAQRLQIFGFRLAADIDSASGNAAEGGDVGAGDSLASVAKTLGVGLGLTSAQVDDQMTAGRTIQSVLAT